MINFNKPPFIGKEQKYIREVIEDRQKICGDGHFTMKCNSWFEKNFSIPKVLLTTSCTHALEMAAILANIQPGDEVIAPSFTFVSTVNAFVLRGAKIIFVDIRPDTMNIDENLIEQAITCKTKAIVPVHYAGVSCEMNRILEIAKKYNLVVIEDAAQGVMSKYNGKALGAIGDLGTYSFHETKNYTMGEGGALLIQNKNLIERAEIIREKGTNRSKFFRGQIDKYSWVDIGSSYLPSELNAAYLYAQLEEAEMINTNRLKTWNLYYRELKELEDKGLIELPVIPSNCQHNAHMFYIKCSTFEERQALIKYLKRKQITASFHYIPLHSSEAGKKYGEFYGEDKYTTTESERILRLPLYYKISEEDMSEVTNSIKHFYKGK
ncbi:dTDP-4-amino-4,6-dideoxygalactose transaminase [Natronobacillus azotifigens]|uniref:dTDP-4-amino-4,6-dideoxygalactose transaminase n=1 Tax=Natronobacillus azotifigens TaxID=472978 RepID=A0A9J6RBS7_9BACI|nr:dTDP-4-amino-4,6-dideoxygalactose transaminase [Natronobacillus azotifigens]MCZ0702999.1 dTDP-4-amino-4,6-dideoxygalactose transaminase [Natronobacillus azotifigens]